MAKVTIITNTIRRSLELVEKSVRASLTQDSSVDVVLVDQNEVPLKFSSEVETNSRFKHQHEIVPSVSMARNRAIYEADCEWLIFCDDDGYLEQGYVQKLKTLINQNSMTDVFAGSIKRIDNGEFYSKRHALGGNMKWFWNLKLLMGSNFAIKREVFEKLGKFDEQFGAGAPYGSSEETDLAWNAYFNGYQLKYVPELVVFHVPPFSGNPEEEIKKAYRYGYGKGRMVRKWLQKHKTSPMLEMMEMLTLPFLKGVLFLLFFSRTQILIQSSTVKGRLMGLMKNEEKVS